VLDRDADGSGTWERLPSFRLCIEIAIVVEPGTDYRFEVPAPDGPGRYRIVFKAVPDGAPAVEVVSNPFRVR
jgi:hypothetical protein